MKIKPWIYILCAPLVAHAAILTFEDTTEVVQSTLMDQYISAINNHPEILKSGSYEEPVYDAKYGPMPTKADDITSFKPGKYTIESSVVDQPSEEVDNVPGDIMLSCSTSLYNSTGWNQELSSASTTPSYTNSSSTAVTDGYSWAEASKFMMKASPEGVGVEDDITITYTTNHSTTDTTTDTYGVSFTAPAQKMTVPPACIGHIDYTLMSISQAGTFSFHGFIGGESYIAIAETSGAGKAVYTGNVLMTDILKFNNLPIQPTPPLVGLDESGKISVVGWGTFSGDVATELKIKVYFESGTPFYTSDGAGGTYYNYCKEETIAESSESSIPSEVIAESDVYDVQSIKNGYSYRIPLRNLREMSHTIERSKLPPKEAIKAIQERNANKNEQN